jgi:hypothetical protein
MLQAEPLEYYPEEGFSFQAELLEYNPEEGFLI